MRRGDEAKADEAVEAALVEAEEKGFDPQRVEGILHQLELSLKHRTADFGLAWCSAVTGAWAMGYAASPIVGPRRGGVGLSYPTASPAPRRRDIVDCVSVGSKLERLREEGRDPDLLRRLLRAQLLEPSAIARASMHPDPGFEGREVRAAAPYCARV